MRPRRDDFGEALRSLVGLSHTIEFERDLDVGAQFQRRRRRHDLVGGNDLVALLQLLEKAGKRHRGQIVGRPEVERQSQVDERRKFVSLAAPRAAQAIERLCRALFRVMNERLQRFIRLQVRKRSLDQRMMGNNEREVLVYLRRSGHIALRVQHSGVSVGEAQAVLVILIR